MALEAFSPWGSRIVGSFDTVDVLAKIVTWKPRAHDGTLDFDYAGESDVDWDSQKTKTHGASRIFVDDQGRPVLEREIVLREVD